MMLNSRRPSLSPLQGNHCSCETISRARGLNDNRWFTNDVTQVGINRKENARTQKRVENRTEVKMMMMKENKMKGVEVIE